MHRLCELANSASHIFEIKKKNAKKKKTRKRNTRRTILSSSKKSPIPQAGRPSFRTVSLQSDVFYPNRLGLCHCYWCRASVWDVVGCASAMRRVDRWTRSTIDGELRFGFTTSLPQQRELMLIQLDISCSRADKMHKIYFLMAALVLLGLTRHPVWTALTNGKPPYVISIPCPIMMA